MQVFSLCKWNGKGKSLGFIYIVSVIIMIALDYCGSYMWKYGDVLQLD